MRGGVALIASGLAVRDAVPALGSAAPSLWVKRLSVTDFRCYAEARLEAGAEPVVLTGPNGAGKTNLLEALSYLSPGRGLREVPLAEADRRALSGERRPWRIAAEIAGPDGALTVGTGHVWAESGRREGRRVKVDGKTAGGTGALADLLALAWLAPEMERLFIEAPAHRRAFFDRLAFGLDPSHARRLAAHDRARRARLKLLREGRGDPAWLDALECQMAEQGVAIAAARLDLIERLNAELAVRDGPFPRPRLAVEGAAEAHLRAMPALAAEEALKEMFAKTRARDAETGTSEGVQRSDFSAEDPASGLPASACSTGEQKALLIAVLLAQARLLARRRGVSPVLLFDEVAAHLDPERRRALFDELALLGVQVWLTGTERAIFAPLEGRARFFRVEKHTVSED